MERSEGMKSNGVVGVMNTPSFGKGVASTDSTEPVQEFGMLLNQRASQGMPNASDLIQSPPEGNKAVQKPQESFEKSKNESGYREINKAGQSDIAQKAEQLEEPYEELKEEITDALTEELGITEEELTEIMELLGITFESLINGDGLKELLMQVNGSQDMTELLFSDAFQELTQTLGLMVQEFTEQAELTPEEWDLVLAKLEEITTGSEVSAEEVIPETEGLLTVEETMEQPPEEAAVLETAETTLTQPKQEKEAASEAVTAEDTETAPKQEEALKPVEQNTEAKHQGKEAASGREEHPMTFQQTQTTVNSAGEVVVETVERTFVDVQDLINQVSEYTRVTVQQSQSSIEMQLNPAHLGKIYLQVVSKEGMITAQLAAQNEAVKEALESQAVQLKETMNQQGLKVEAVEVTIASHEFEQNLENQGQQNMQEEAGRENSRPRRFLSADQLEDVADTLTEEESLAAQIMLENGNHMDMMA